VRKKGIHVEYTWHMCELYVCQKDKIRDMSYINELNIYIMEKNQNGTNYTQPLEERNDLTALRMHIAKKWKRKVRNKRVTTTIQICENYMYSVV
jgi:hypothetical protein